jgi:hypothetical protein
VFIEDLSNPEVLQLWENNFTEWVRTFLTAPAPSEPWRSGAAPVARALLDRLVDAEAVGEDENLRRLVPLIFFFYQNCIV